MRRSIFVMMKNNFNVIPKTFISAFSSHKIFVNDESEMLVVK